MVLMGSLRRILRLVSLGTGLLLAGALVQPGLPQGRSQGGIQALLQPRVALAAPSITITVDPTTVTEPGLVTITVDSNEALTEPPDVQVVRQGSSSATAVSMGDTSGGAGTQWQGTYAVNDGDTSGTYEVSAQATSATGTTSALTTFEVNLGTSSSDTTPPTLTVTPGKTSVKPGDSLTITVHASETLEKTPTVTVGKAGGTTESVTMVGISSNYWSGTYSVPSSASEGTYYITATGTDLAGNTGTGSNSFVVDGTQPVLSVTASPDPVEAGSKVTITVLSNEPLKSPPMVTVLQHGTSTTTAVTMTGSGTQFTGGYMVDPAAAYETFDVNVYGTDVAGNTGYAATTFSSVPKPDTTPPTLTVSTSPSAVQPGNSVTITVKSNEYLSDTPTAVVAKVGGSGQSVPLFSSGTLTWQGTYQVSDTETDGSFTVTAQGKDLAGNQGSGTGSFTVDTESPTLTVYANPALAKEGTKVTIDISASEALAAPPSVAVLPPGGQAEPVTMSGSGGTWSGVYLVKTGSTNGTYTVTANGSDAAGNTGGGTTSFTVDTNKPDIDLSLSQQLAKANDTVYITIKSNEPLGITPLVVVSPPSGPGLGLAVTATSETTWNASYLVLSTYPDGTYTVTVTAQDAAGNITTESATLIVDTTPSIFTLKATPTYVKPGSTVSISLTSSEYLSGDPTITVALADGPEQVVTNLTATSATSWSASYAVTSGAAEGVYTVRVTGTDAAGNPAEETTTFIVDATPPQVTIAAAPSPVKPGATVTITVQSNETLAPLTAVAVTRKNGPTQSVPVSEVLGSPNTWEGTFIVPDDAPHGAIYTAGVTGVDLAGNQSPAKLDPAFVVDAVKPVLTVSASPTLVRMGDSVSITVTSDEALAVAPVVEVLPEGATAGQALVVVADPDQENSWVGIYTIGPGDVDGLYTVTVTGSDPAGNEATQSTTFTADLTPPTLTLTALPDPVKLGGRVMVSVSSSEPLTGLPAVTYAKENDPAVALTLAPEPSQANQWSGSFTIGLYDAHETVYTVAVTGTDLAGNTAGNDVTVTVDGSAPKFANVTVAAGTTAATIRFWIDDQFSTVDVEFGTDATYGSTAQATSDVAGTGRQFTAELTGLTPNTSYAYRITAENPIGNQSFYTGAFTTWPTGGAVPDTGGGSRTDTDTVYWPGGLPMDGGGWSSGSGPGTGGSGSLGTPPATGTESGAGEQTGAGETAGGDANTAGAADGGTGTTPDTAPGPGGTPGSTTGSGGAGGQTPEPGGNGGIAGGGAAGGQSPGWGSLPQPTVATVALPTLPASDSTTAGLLAALNKPRQPEQAGVVAVDQQGLSQALGAASGAAAPGNPATPGAGVRLSVQTGENQPLQALLVPPAALSRVSGTGAELEFQGSQGSLVLGPEALRSLAAAGGERGWGVVYLDTLPDGRIPPELLAAGTAGQPGLTGTTPAAGAPGLRPVSPVVEVRAGIIGAGGSFQPLDPGPGAATLTLPYDPRRVQNPKLLGIYRLVEDAQGRVTGWQYAGGRPGPNQTVSTGEGHLNRVSLSGKYVVAEYSREYVDVPREMWAYETIQIMSARQVVRGNAAGRFEPNRPVTRAEFATMLVRALGLPENPQTGSQFRDVHPEDWYAGAIGAAVATGLFRGDGDGQFRPETPISRQEMAVILGRVLMQRYQQQGLDPSLGLLTLTFYTDSGSVAPWAQEGVALTLQSGLMRGRAGNQFAPLEIATRAETATVLQRLMDLP